MTRCSICNSEAGEIDRGHFDGVGFDRRFLGRFRVSGTVLAQGKERTRRQWEHALMAGKGAGIGRPAADHLGAALAQGSFPNAEGLAA